MNTAQELIAQVADLPAMRDGDHSRWINRAIAVMAQQQQEIATLRSRIDTAPVAIMDTRKALGLCAPTEAAFEDLCALQGHRVALIDLGVEK